MGQGKYAEKRLVRNFLIAPGSQLRVAFSIILFGLMTIVVSVVYFLYSMNSIFESLAVLYQIDPEIVASLKQSLLSTGILTAGLGVVFTLVTLAFIIVLTHRFIGPAVPINRLISELKEGNYGVRGKLRERDEYKDVMDSLNELAAALEAQYGGKKAGTIIER